MSVNNLVVVDKVSKEILRTLLPRNSSAEMVQSIGTTLHKLISDEEPEFRDTLRDNILGYADIIKTGRYKIDDYLNAVKFVSWRLAGNTFIEAYKRTFPDRHTRLVDSGKTAKEISSYVAAYSKNKLVVQLTEQALIPSYILNADIFQKAVNNQVAIMEDDEVSPMVRMSAADSLLKHLKQPETSKIALDIRTDSNNDAMLELRQVTQDLRDAQRQAIERRDRSVIDIAHARIMSEDVDGSK